MNVVKMTYPTRDEILDGYLEIIKSEQDKGMMAFYEIAKTLKLAQDAFGLEHGSNQYKSRKEDVNKLTTKYTSFSDFCEKASINRTAALSYIKTVDMIGFDADVSKVKTTVTALTNLAYQPKEVQEEFLPKILDGEKVKVKEVLKSLTKPQREVVAQANYEIAEEERTGMTSEELDTFYAKQEAEYDKLDSEIKTLKPIVKKQMAQLMTDAHREAYLDEIELYQWVLDIKVFAESKGYSFPILKRENNLIVNSNKELAEQIEYAKSQVIEVFN